MRVRNMTSERSGREVANQFEIFDDEGNRFFQSYGSVIAKRERGGRVLLDAHYWDYSRTTGKYRNQFLGEGIEATRKKIESGIYTLTNLNEGA